tara:strand:- start:10890 stop:11471 length:582 start_codon:yes stop_codon:yes gene_type:complete
LPTLGKTFSYTNVGKKPIKSITVDLYVFKCNFNHKYIIEVEHHEDDIYIVKFFKKSHTNSRNRYSLLNKKHFLKKNKTTGARNFLMVLNTIIKLILKIYEINPMASFGFIGAPTMDELDIDKNESNINEDGTVAKTKRYNVYGLYVKRYFNPSKFEHIELESSSGYLIKNPRNLKLTTPKVESFFENYITEYC